jgi:hypothetical protein
MQAASLKASTPKEHDHASSWPFHQPTQSVFLFPCFVPKLPLAGSNLPLYLNALEALEAKGLISVDRSAPHYRGWIMNHAKGVCEETQQGLTASWK